MGSPLNPSIILAGNNPPPVGAVQSIGLMMQQRQLASENALRAAQTTQAQQQTSDLALQNQIRQRALQDQGTFQQTMMDPDNAKAIMGGDLSSLQGKIRPDMYLDLQAKINDNLKTKMAMHEDQLKDRVAAHGQIADTINSLKTVVNPDGTPDIATINSMLPSANQQLAQNGVFKDAGISEGLPSNISDVKQLDHWLAINGALWGANEKALELKQQQAKIPQTEAQTQEAASTAALNAAKQPGAAAESAKQQLILQAMQRGQSAQANRQHPIDAILGGLDPQAAAAYKPAYDSAMANGGPEAAKSILEAAAAHAGQISMALNPSVQQQKVNEAVATEKATAPVKTQTAIDTAKALRMGDNAAIAGVAPAAAVQVQNQAIKLDQDYAAGKAATETLGHVLDLAGQGNAAAGANVAAMGAAGIAAVNGIKRLNPALVEGYGNAGSLLQDLQGKLSHWEGTGPLPKSLLDEIRELHQTIGQQAYQTYTDGLNTLNTRSGSKFAPTLPAPNISRGPAAQPIVQHSPSTGQYRYSLDGGKTWQMGQPSKQ